MGHEVLIVAPRDAYTAQLIAEGFAFHHIDLDNYGVNPFYELRTIHRLAKIYRAHRPDFIFHYTIKPNVYGSIAARRHGIPCIAITTGLGHLFAFPNPLVRRLTVMLYKLAARLSLQVWFLNRSDRERFLSEGIVSQEKVRLLPGEGVNIERFRPPEGSFRAAAPLFLFAGRVIWEKGLRQFADAARALRQRHPSARFAVLGFIDPANPNSVPYEQITEWQREGILQYLGETADVRPFLEEASCLVFPSFYGEGVSRILLEAAAMARPIITTDHVGCREAVRHGYNGLLCRPGDTADLIDKLEFFMRMPELERRQMGLNGRRLVLSEFDEELVIDRYLSALTHFLGEPAFTPLKIRRDEPA